jgi:phenol hydroxylase P3 protein
MEAEGKRFYSAGLPQLCQVCQIPMTFTEMGDDPTLV